MQHFICPYCGLFLDNQALCYLEENQNANEFWCDNCGKIYIIEENGSCIVEESI